MKLITTIIMSCTLIFLGGCERGSHSNAQYSHHPVLDHIKETQTLRCGYATWAPLFTVDANTKQMSGLFYDVVEEAAKRLNIKVKWTEEVGWGTAAESVKNGRIDAVCSGFWINSTRAQFVDFSTPIIYSVAYVWVRSDANYPAKSMEELNTPSFSFGYLDGSADVKITQARFPKAKGYSMPELTPLPDVLAGLAAKKYDALGYDDATMSDYLKTHPGVFKKLFPDQSLAIYPTVLMLPAGEVQLKAMIDNTLREMLYDGTMANIVNKYHVEKILKLPAKPFAE